jgi:hypothetical protein
MITSGELFVCLVAGLAVPLAILDAARTVLEGRLPVQGDGLQLERRLVPWFLGFFAGPALLFDRIAEGWREGTLSGPDIASGAFITAGWAAIYGFVLLKAAQFLGA